MITEQVKLVMYMSCFNFVLVLYIVFALILGMAMNREIFV